MQRELEEAGATCEKVNTVWLDLCDCGVRESDKPTHEKLVAPHVLGCPCLEPYD